MPSFRSFPTVSLKFIPDKEYRKGVHWLETLRLRRTKILEGAYAVWDFALVVVHPDRNPELGELHS